MLGRMLECFNANHPLLLVICCTEMQSIATTEMANSVITLLRGAGLLDNLTEMAEKRRIEDEHVLTEKLEMVKGMLICLTYLQPCT